MQNQPGAPPVFVDRTGRRRRLTVIAGTAVGLGLLASLGLILAGLFFDSSVPIPGWSDTKGHPPIEAGVDAPAPPRERTSPSAPAPGTSITAPLPSSAPTATSPTSRTATSGPQSSTSVPGQGDEHRTSVRPSRTPGKP